MQVLKDEDERATCRDCSEEVGDLMEEGGLARDRADGTALGEGGGQRWHSLVLLISPEGFNPRSVRGRFRQVVAVADEDKRPPLSRLAADSVTECGLPDTRFAANQDCA